MNSKSLRRAWMLGPVLSLSVALASCSGPVPAGTNTPGGNGSNSGGGSGGGPLGGSTINLDPGKTSTSVSTDTEVTDDKNCGVTQHTATKEPANLLLILDRSGSMEYGMNTNGTCKASDTGCVARWPTMKTALAQVLSTSGEGVTWGLKLYSTPGQGECAVSAGVEVPIAAGTASQIEERINDPATAPGEGRTPTREAVTKGTAYLTTVTAPGSKSILLATDGQPNCKGGRGSGGEDVPGTTTAIKAAFDAGFRVYILGIGPETSTEALNGFADAGGTSVKDVGGPGKNYYAALSAEELSKHFNSIVGSVASCSFKLDKKPDVPDNIAVEFDGNKDLRAPRSKTDGWEYTSDTTIQLYGSWCDGLTNGTYKNVKVLFGCKGQIIP